MRAMFEIITPLIRCLDLDEIWLNVVFIVNLISFTLLTYINYIAGSIYISLQIHIIFLLLCLNYYIYILYKITSSSFTLKTTLYVLCNYSTLQ